MSLEPEEKSIDADLDYSSVVVHIFQKEIRDFYCLEDLWGDAVVREIIDELA